MFFALLKMFVPNGLMLVNVGVTHTSARGEVKRLSCLANPALEIRSMASMVEVTQVKNRSAK